MSSTLCLCSRVCVICTQHAFVEDEFHEYVNDLSNELTQDQEVNAIGSSKLNEFIQSHEINKEKKNLLCVDDFKEIKE